VGDILPFATVMKPLKTPMGGILLHTHTLRTLFLKLVLTNSRLCPYLVHTKKSFIYVHSKWTRYGFYYGQNILKVHIPSALSVHTLSIQKSHSFTYTQTGQIMHFIMDKSIKKVHNKSTTLAPSRPLSVLFAS
jgi:hypothetical protein